MTPPRAVSRFALGPLEGGIGAKAPCARVTSRASPEGKRRSPPVKKRHARAKKAIFRLETGFFSRSIRSASEECRFPLVINQLLEGNNHGNCEKSCGEKGRKEG